MNFTEMLASCERVASTLVISSSTIALQHRHEIEEAQAVFADEASRSLYMRDIHSCLLRTFLQEEFCPVYSGLMSYNQFYEYCQAVMVNDPCPELESHGNPPAWVLPYAKVTTFLLEQYAYRNLVGIEEGDVVLNCGACLGDTSIWMLRKGAARIYAFEIDRDNIACMRRNLEKVHLDDKVEIVPKALYSAEGSTFYLPSANPGAGRLLEQPAPGAYMVEMTTIDSFVQAEGIRPTFVKMDIEGAEPEALKGARNTLVDCRPRLAICIYHSFEQRFQIPLFLRDLLPDYEFYLKKSHPHSETVLFGRPRKKA